MERQTMRACTGDLRCVCYICSLLVLFQFHPYTCLSVRPSVRVSVLVSVLVHVCICLLCLACLCRTMDMNNLTQVNNLQLYRNLTFL